MTFRDSFISTSTNTYPSTMSMPNLSNSTLGLTDSPRSKSTATASSTSTTSSPSLTTARRALRPVASRTSLQQEATVNAAHKAQAAQSRPAAEQRTVVDKSSRSSLKDGSRSPSRAREAAQPSRLLTEEALAQVPSRPATTPARATNATTAPNSEVKGQVSPVKRPQTAQPPRARPPAQQRAPASPARTDITFAEEWEAELIRNAQQLRIDPQPQPQPRAQSQAQSRPKSSVDQEQEALRKSNQEWERSGSWEGGDPAREAEDRVRRDAGRAIAYPPSTPRVPVRAAPSGATSVHIGVRPRLHPSRASDSMLRNQPDLSLPEPLFSPRPSDTSLPGDSVKGSYNQRYGITILEKAKKEYEDWLARKAEREGGIGGDEGGTRDWVPSNRVAARPGAVEGLAHSDGYVQSGRDAAYPYAMDWQGQPITPKDGDDQYAQEYWNPANWWGTPMPNAGAGHGEASQVQMVTVDPGSATRKVEFAEPIPEGAEAEDAAAAAAAEGIWDPSYGDM